MAGGYPFIGPIFRGENATLPSRSVRRAFTVYVGSDFSQLLIETFGRVVHF
jgi:hypothetical protein